MYEYSQAPLDFSPLPFSKCWLFVDAVSDRSLEFVEKYRGIDS
jgi:hypothetical protein